MRAQKHTRKPRNIEFLTVRRHQCRGFTMMEFLMVLLILSVAIIPMVTAFAPARISAAHVERSIIFLNQARGTLNRVISIDFETLSANAGDDVDLAVLLGSDHEAGREAFLYDGAKWTPRVDISDSSGGEGGLLQITVLLDNVDLSTLKSER